MIPYLDLKAAPGPNISGYVVSQWIARFKPARHSLPTFLKDIYASF